MAPLYMMRSVVLWANWPGGVVECIARKNRKQIITSLLFEKKILYVTKKWIWLVSFQYNWNEKRFSFVNSEVALKEQLYGDFAAFMVSVVLSHTVMTASRFA